MLLGCEQLEDRSVPAALAYTGLVQSNVMNQYNWWDYQSHYYATPTRWDDLVFVGPQSSDDPGNYLPAPITATPGSMEYQMMVAQGVPVNQPLAPNADVTIPIGSLPTVHGVRLLSHYTGHVSVSDNQTIGWLDLQTGNHDQLGYNSDLTISTRLQFLGGTLNSTSNLGVVHITGNGNTPGPASANLKPPDGGSLTLGSTLSVEGLGYEGGGAGMGIYVGNYLTINDPDIITGEYCSTTVGLPAMAAATVGNAVGPEYQTSRIDFAKHDVDNRNKPYTLFVTKEKGRCDFIKNFRGSVKLLDAGSMSVAAGVTVFLNDPVDLQKDYSISVPAGGTFSMSSGSKLIINQIMSVAGTFNTLYVPGYEELSGPSRTKQTVMIFGSVDILATGTLSITEGALAGQYGRLEITGDLGSEGTLKMQMNGGKDGNAELVDCDYINVGKALAFSATSKLVIAATNATGEMSNNRKWNLAKATDGIVGTVPTPPGRYQADKVDADMVNDNKILVARYVAP